MMASKQDLLSQVLSAFEEGVPQQQNRLKTTSVPGYPVFLSWGFLSAIEVDDKGAKKAILLCPFLSIPALSISVSPLTLPAAIMDTNMVYPQNFKLKIPDHINSTQLKEGLPYAFLAAFKPGAINGSRGGSAVGYWDGYLVYISQQINGEIETFLNHFKASRGSSVSAAPVAPAVPATPPPKPV